MKRLVRFVLLTLGYLVAVARVAGRRFVKATRVQRRKFISSLMIVFVGLGAFFITSANAANELGYNSTIDYSLTFNGTNPIQVADPGTSPTDFTTNFTVEAWINPGACTATRCMITNKENSWEWVVYNGVIEYAIVTSAGNWAWITTSAQVPSNRWSHVAWVKSGTAMKFYVNGALADGTRTTGQTTSVTNDPFTIGGRLGDADRYTGAMDELKLWNTARTSSEILLDMHAYGDAEGTNLLDNSALVGYYDFNEGTNVGAQIYDRTTNAKHVSVVSGATKPTYNDIKTTTVLGGDTVYTFPRSYITPVGGWTAPSGATRARVLVVAGGGGGGPGQGSGYEGAGGGAGGMREISPAPISGVMKITVGQGGYAAPHAATYDSSGGQDSAFGPENSVGGGGGLHYASQGLGQSGGSGSGALMFKGDSTSPAASGGSGIPGQGNSGGKNATGTNSNNHYASGGGGGAGTAGGNASTTTGGAAGNGAVSDITGTSLYYAGGGSGAGRTSNGSANTTYAATPVGTTPAANTGSGGAGGKSTGTAATAGGSGVVIVRYSPQVDNYLSNANGAAAPFTTSTGPIPTSSASSYTIETWIKPVNQATGTRYHILGQQSSVGSYGSDRVYLGLNDGKVGFATGGNSNVSQAAVPWAKVPMDAWSHIAVTVTGNTVKMYIDAQLIYQYAYWFRANSGSLFYLGSAPQGSYNNWQGGLDQVKIWNTALSEDDIRASMNAYQAPGSGAATTANLLAHYDFNELSSTGGLLDRWTADGTSTNLVTTASSPSMAENIETSTSANSRNAIRFTRNYLTAAGGWTVPAGAARADALVVAGGGGGGAHIGAGGGAGGFIEKPVTLTPGTVIPIQVGQGGGGGMLRETTWSQSTAGETYVSRYGAATGNNSILGSAITANGGGRGANWTGIGETGGSGGGSNYTYSAGGAGTAGQGNAGGYTSGATYNNSDSYVTGGGGGAGGVGGSPAGATRTSGAGGIGKISNLWATGIYYAGGGGGGFHTPGAGGIGGAGGVGGGGAGTGGVTKDELLTPGNGTPNTGGGGGGGGNHAATGYQSMGGNGGSGVIVLSYGGYLDLSNTPKARRATQQFDVAPIIKIKNNDGSQLSGSQHTVTVTTETIGNLTFGGTALTTGKPITASDGVFDFTGLGFATGVTTAQVLTFTSPDFVDYQVTVAPKFSPTTVQIVADSAAASTAGYFDSTGQFYADAAASTNIRVSDLYAAMVSTDVRIDATSTISVDTAANTSASAKGLTLVAASTLTVATGNSLTTGGALTLTGSSVTINGPVTSSGTTLISSTSSTGVNTIAANVKNTLQGARLTFKSAGDNTNTVAATIQTNKAPLVFWADSDGSEAGYNRTQNGSTFNTVNGVSTDTATDGGDMVFAGGRTLDASDYPTGYGFGTASYGGFHSGSGTTNKTAYFTGGGKFVVRGKTSAAFDSVTFESTTQVWANVGQISVTGVNPTVHGSAIRIQRGGTTTQTEFFSSSNVAPAIEFTASGSGGYGFLSSWHNATEHVVMIQAPGTGGVTITGRGGGGDLFDLGISGTDILSRGDITLVNQGTGSSGGFFTGQLGNGYGGTSNVIGYCAPSTCTNSRVTTSSANINITGDRFSTWDADVRLKVNTAGTFKFEPNSATGFYEFKAAAQGLSFSTDCTGITIGKDQKTDTFYWQSTYPNITINGPIRFYVGRLELLGNLESTAAGSEIRLKSPGAVYVGVKTLKTNNGNIVIWSNSDKVEGTANHSGSIYIESGAQLLSNGGKIWLAGGLDDGGQDASITTSRGKWASVVSGDALPDGYATGWNQSDYWGVGVVIGALVNIKSSNGDIFIAGQQGLSGTSGYGHVGIWYSTTIDSGNGKVAIWARSPDGANQATQGIALHNAVYDYGPVVITSNAAAADAITLYSDSSASSGSWARGITSAWHSAWDNARGHQGAQIVATNLVGGITLTGIGGGGSSSLDAVGVRLDYTDILARGGPITINGMSSASAGSQGLSVGRDSGGNSAVRLGGWKAGTTGAVGGGTFTTTSGTFDLSTSSSPININIDSAYMYEGGKGTIFGTSGAVAILPVTYSNGIGVEADNFKRIQTEAQLRFGQTSFPTAAASFTLGRVNTSTDIAYYGAVNSVGDIKIYGGTLTSGGNLTTMALDSRVQLKGKVAVNQASTSTIRTNSGKIVLWADSDNSGGGNMAISGTLCTAPTATTCNTNASTDGDDIILGGGAADAADSSLPSGYASGTSSSTMQESSGIQLGTLGSANTGPKVYSSGGNITIRGQTFVTTSAVTVWTIAVPFLGGTELNSGAGKISVSAATAAPGYSGTGAWLGGIEFNAWGGTTKLISTNAATDAIKVRVENLQNGGTAKITGTNSGTSFTNSAGGGLLIQADWFDDAVDASFGVTGPIVIEPVNASFINTAFNLDSSYSFTANPKGLRLGKAGNTLGVTASTAVTSTGPIQLYGGTVSATADLTTTNASEILLKGTEDVVVGAGTNASTRRTLSTTGGPITLWSNSDYSGSGAISTSNFTSFLSRGGKITMAGSASANEVSPTGFAVGSTTYASGVRLGSAAAASNLTISTDGGDILIQGTTGRNITDAMGVLQYGGSTINSGAGAIKIDARTTGSTGTINGHGIELGFAGTAPTVITSSKSSDTAIDINGQTQGSSSDGKGVNFWSGDATNYVKISATGTAGNVSISGSASTSTQPGISMNWARVLSKGGTVTLNSGTNPTAFGNNSSTGAIHIGADTNGGATGNIDINAGSFTWAGTVNVKTAGDLSIDSGAAQSFASAFSLPANLVVSEINDLRIGNAGTSASNQNTSNVTMSRDVSDSGNVEVYGGSVALRSNITTTGGASSKILVRATAAITSANSASFTTSGADITFWADADASNSGNIWIGETNTFTTSGGRVTLAGGADDGGSTVVSGRSSGDDLPDGFAWGTGATTVWNENNRGVMLTASATINTSGGSVFIAGHGPNQFVGEGGQGVVLGRGTQIKSAAGKIGIFGVTNATGSKTNAFNTGVELQGFTATGSRTLQIVSSNGSSDAIDIRGDSSASTSESSPGVAAINFETRTASANFIVNTGSGGVQITGRSGTTTFRDLSDMIGDGIELGLAAVLAKSGPITFTGDTSASSSGASYGFALDHTTMTNYSSAPSFIGSRQSTTIDSVDMSTSSSNITFNVDSLYNLDARNAKSILTTGSVTVQPARSAQSFDRALTFKGFTLGAAVSGLTIGSAGTSAATQTASAITMEQSTSIAGPIAVYGGDVTNSANLTATGSTGSISINSNGTFTNSAAISSAGGNQPTTIKAEKAALTGSINSGTGVTQITGFNAARTIDLGLAGDTTATLALTDTELDTITAGTIRVGDSTSGAITVSVNITIDNAKAPKFALRTVGNVTATNNATISATNLGIDAGGTITLGGANSISGNLALVAGGASGGSGASFGASGAFTPASVDAIEPVYGLGKNISVSSAPAIGSTEVRYLNQTWSAPPVVTVKDAYGYTISTNNNTKNTYTTDVTDSGAPTVAGATPVIAGGTQTFSSLKFTTSTGSTALTFTTAGLVAGGTSTVTTGTYSVEAGEPATIAITYDAIEAPAGKTGFGIRATLKDAGGNTVSGPHATDTITVDVSDADADSTNNATIISGNTPSTVAGVANFSNLILGGKVGVTYTLTFTVTYLDSTATSQTVTATRTVTLTPGDANKVKVQTPAAGFVNRSTFSTQPIIAIKDAYDNTVTSSSASVSVAVTAVGTASTQGLSGSTSVNASSGVATFAGLGKTGLVGTKRLTFSSSTLSSDTQDFTLTYGAAHHITSVVSSNLVNDTVFATQPVVTIQDEDGNTVGDSTATVTLTSANATIGGTLLNGAVAMDAVAGVANFSGKNVKLTGTIGAKTLTATVAGLTAVNSTVTISYGAATQLFLSRDASDAVNGVVFGTQPQIIVQDISGNTVTNSTAAITVESSGSVLSGNSTPPTLANGVATFSGLKLTGTKGTYTLTYRSGGLTLAAHPITVAYGAATKLILTTSPLGFVNRTNFTTQPVITVQDASGNTVENSSISIDVAIDSGNLTGTTQIAAVNGVATFSGLGKNGTIGSKRLTFTKTGGGLTQAIFDFTLTYGAPTQLALTTDAADFVNRVAFGTQPVIEIQDADGNKVADSTASVTVAMTGGGTLDGTDTVSAIAGVATFSGLSARGSIANNNVLAFTSSQLTGVSQASFNLTHGAAHHIYTTAGFNGTTSILSGTRKSGVAFGQQPKVAIVDEDNNLVSTGSESTQNVTVAADVTGLTGTTTVAAVGGLATYSGLTMTALMGNYTLTYTAATSGSTGTTPFYLSYGNASKLSLTTEADGFVNRTNFTTQPVVTVQDSMGNTVGDATISIDVAIDSGSLTGTTQVRSVAGVATFAGLGKYGTIGAKTLTFSKAGGGLTVDTQDFTLTFGAAHHITSVVSSSLVNDTVFATQPVVKIRDQDENVVTDSTATVTLTSGNATIGGTLFNGAVAMDAVAGVADFSGKNVKLTGTIGAKTLTATVAGLTAVDSTVTITYGAATKLFLSRDATDAVNGVAFGTQPKVVVQDVSGNTVANSTAVITVESSGSVLTGNSTPPTLANGVATFSGLTLTGDDDTFVLTYKSTGLADAVQNITVSYGAATKLILTTSPLGFVNRTNFTTQPVITVQDASGNTVVNASMSIDVSSDTNDLTGTLRVNVVNGIATFAGLGNAGLVGAKHLTFKKVGGGLTVATFDYTLTYGAVHHLSMAVANTLANDTAWATQPVVTIQDEDSNTVEINSTVTLTASGATTVAIAGTTTMDAVDGVANFTGKGVKLTGLAGSKTLSAGITVPGTFSVPATITLGYGAATKLSLTTEPAGFVNRTNFTTQPIVTVQDVSGNTVGNSAISIDVTIDTGDVTGTTRINAVNGVATFAGLGKTGTIGLKTLTFKDTAGLLTVDTKQFTLTHGAAHHTTLAVASSLVNATDFATQPVVTIYDQDDNVVTSGSQSTQTVTLTATGASTVAIGGAVTMDAADGVANFTGKGVKLTGLIGAKSLTATIASPSSIVATETVTITYGAATKLAISTDAADASNGSVFGTQPVILVQDVSGNLVANSTVVVTPSVSDGTLDGTDVAGVTAVGGVATFTDLGLTATAGSKTLTFSSSPLTAATQSITAVTGAPTQLRIDVANTLVNNTVFATQPVVTLLDASGIVVSVGNYAAQTVTLSSPDSNIGGTVSMQSTAGVADFVGKGVKLEGIIGGRTLKASISSPSSVDATETVTITYGAAHHLHIASAASGIANRIAFTNQPAIEVRDISGNVVGNSTAQISVAATGANGAVLGGDTSMNATSGIAYFAQNANGLKLTGSVGAYRLTYSSGALSADSQDVTLTHGTATKIVVSRSAASAKSGQAFGTQPKIQIQDADSNLVNTGVAATAQVRLTVSSDAYDSAAHTGVDLLGPANFETATASAGEATFASARLEGVAATYTLKFETVNTTGFNGLATSQTIGLTAGTETQLRVVQQPTAIIAGAAFSPTVTVEILDAWKNRVLDVASNVAIKPTLVDAAVLGNEVDATKSAVANSSGLVTFTGLTFTKAGTQFVRFTSTNLTAATSGSFVITNAQAHHLTWVNSSATFSAKNDYAIKDGLNANPELEVRDQYENPVLTGNATTVAVTESTSSADVKAISGASVSSDAYARIAFANLVMRAKTGSYTLNFTAANASLSIDGDVETATVSINHGDPAALRLTRNAAGANVDLPFTTQPKLNIEDTAGNVVADSSLAVTVSENVSQVLSGTTNKSATAGSVDFTDSGLKLSGTVQTGLRLKYAVTYNGTEISTSQDIDLDPGLAIDLTVGQQPTTVKTRVAFNSAPTVILLDGSGNQVTSDSSSTVTAQLKDSTGNPVGAETAAFTASGGVVTFTGLSFQAPSTEDYSVTFKLTSNNQAVTSTVFDILPGVATELRITQQPSTDTVDHTPGKTGELLSSQPIAKLYDQDGNLVTTTSTGSVTIRVKSTDSAGDLSEGTLTANITGGIATFSGVKFVGTPGVTYTLDFATASPNPVLTSLASTPISVTHNDATHLVVTQIAANGRSGMLFDTQPVVTVKDRYENTVTTGADSGADITATGEITAPTAGVTNPSNDTATATAGVATFRALGLTGSVANTYKLNFNVVGSNTIAEASQSNITISYGSANHLTLTQQPVGGNATGSHLATQPVVEVRDGAENRVANSTLPIAVTINSTAGLILADGSAARLAGASKAAVGGIATFDALDLYGLPGTNYVLKFAVTGIGFATSSAIQVQHAGAHHLTITQQPTGGNATGASLAGQPTLQLRDAFENVVSSDSTDVITARLSTTSARERLEGNSTVTLNQGTGAFAGLKVVALPDTDYTLDFSVVVGSTTITSVATISFRVTYSTPTQLAVAQQPSGGTTGVALNTQPIIEVQDVYGNRVYNYVGDVTATVSGNATLTSSSLSLAVTSGQAAFTGLAVTGVPLTDYQLTFASSGLTSVNSEDIRVTPGAPVRIVILNQPVGAENRAALQTQPVVEIQDSFGNRVTQDSSTVITAALTSGADGTLTRVVSSNSVAIQATVSNGVATFSNLYMRGLTNRNYRMTFSSGDVVAAQSANYTVNHAAVAQLIWNTQPAVGMTGSPLTRAAVLELQDLEGNIADTDNSTVVTATITTGVGGTLASATATAANGVVTFANLTLTGTPGTSYKLTFTGVIGGSTVTAIESVALTPTHAVPAKVTMRGGNVTGGLTGENLTSQPTLYVRDRFDNIATSDNSTVVTAAILNDSTGSVSGNVTATAVNGEVTFAGLKVSGTPGTSYTLRFTASSSGTSLTPVNSNTFTVSKVARVDLAYTAQAYAPNAVVPVQFSTDSPGDITFSTNASSTVCTLNRGTGDLTIKGVGSCLVRVDLDTSLDGFYRANYAEATLVISKAQQAPVTFTSVATVDYWSSLNPTAIGGSGTGALTYSVVTGSTCRLIGATILPGEAGSLCQITATRAGDDNYLPETSAVQTIEVRKINQATLTIASSQTIDAVDTHTLFTAGGSGTGAVTYSIVSSGTARCRIAVDVLTASADGTCAIKATKAASTNYNAITSANQTVTVNLEEQTVAFTSTAPMYPVVSGSYTPTATATSGLAVTYSIATNNAGVACAFDSATPTKINFTATGICEVVATQVGTSRYGYASVRQIIRVGLLNQTIAFDVIPDLNFGTPAFKLLPTTNAGASAVVTLSTTSNSNACSIAGDVVTLTAAGYCEIAANQSGYGAYAAATEVIRGFKVLADFAGAPRIFSSSVTTHALTASFTAPSYTGGAPITGFALIATDANGLTYENAACPVGASPITCTIVGLPNDVAYTAVARAITSAGRGTASNVTAAQTPMDAPMAVTNLSAATSNNDLVVSWSPPTALDGTFTRYDIFVAAVGSAFPETTPYNVTDVNATSTTLQNILNQTVTPTPTPTATTASARVSFRRASVSSPAPSSSSNSQGVSNAPAGYKVAIVTITSTSTVASNANTASGMQTSFSVPLSPSQLTLTVTGDDLMTSWSAPTADGGSPVTGYDVKVNGSTVCAATTSLFCEFQGMQPGRTYSVEVLAINAVGSSAASAASHSVAALPPAPGINSYATPNGMTILGVSAKTALTSGGQLLTLNARNFAGVTSVTLEGKPVKIVSNSEDHITLELPAHEAGPVDLIFKSKIGTLVFQDAVMFIAPPRADAKQTFSRYRTNFVATNAKMIASIRSIILAKEAPKAMVCVGLVPVKYTANDVKLAKIRAANVCAVGAKLDGNLAVRSTTGITKLTGPAARAVKVTYKY